MMSNKEASHQFAIEFKKKYFWKMFMFNVFPMICVNMRHSTTNYMVVNPRYTTSRIESNTVNTRHMTCRICDSMRHVAVFRIESVVLQVTINLLIRGAKVKGRNYFTKLIRIWSIFYIIVINHVKLNKVLTSWFQSLWRKFSIK